MNCERIEELLLRSLDGELDGSERRAVERHLGSCDRCRRSRATFMALEQALEARRDEMPSAARIADAVIRRVSPPTRHPRVAPGWRRTAAISIVVVGASLLGALYGDRLGPALGRALDSYTAALDLLGRLPGWISGAAGGQWWVLLSLYAALTLAFVAAGGLIVRRTLHG